MIEQLPTLVPNPSRTDRTRARCHKKLAHHFRPRDERRFVIERAVFLSCGAIYLSSLAFAVVQMLPW